MDAVEAEGRTVNEATAQALQTLGLRRDQVEVEVLAEGRPRLLGFRGEPARVRVTPLAVVEAPAQELEDEEDVDDVELDDEDIDSDDDYDDDGENADEEEYEDEDEEEHPLELQRRAPVARDREEIPALALDSEEVGMAVSTLQTLLNHMGVDASVEARQPETAGDGVGMIEAVLDIDGDDLGILIGRRGQTLQALQYMLNLIVSKQANRRVAFGVDVDGYRRRREDALISLAKRTASRVKSSGRSITLEPMPPNERRIVHITLASDPNVMTVSIGEGEARKVAITPTR